MADRTVAEYGGKSFSILDVTGNLVTLHEVATKLQYTSSALHLEFQGWKSVNAFATYQKSLERWKKTFALIGQEYTDTLTAYQAFFDLIQQGALGWLNVSENDYDLISFDLDVLNTSIAIKAQSKTRANRVISDSTADVNKFNQLKIDYPEIVQGFFGFVWTFGKAQDAELQLFN